MLIKKTDLNNWLHEQTGLYVRYLKAQMED